MTYLFRLLLLLAIPTIAIPFQPEQGPFNGMLPIEQAVHPAFDDILELIDEIENSELEERCSSEQIEKVAYFLSILARNGAAPSDPISLALIDQDINTLLCEASSFRFLTQEYPAMYSIEPAASFGNEDVPLCKSWVSKQSHSLKKFVKKHKTAIIIGAAVVVAVTIAVIAVVAISSASAATSAVTGLGAAAQA